MEKSGCRFVLAIIFTLIAAAFVINFRSCGANGPSSENSDQSSGPAVATIGDYKITTGMLQTRMQMSASDPNTTSALDAVRSNAQAIEAAVTQGLLVKVAASHGMSLDDKSVMDALSKNFDQSLMMTRMQLVSMKKLAENATDAQFAAAVKAQTGKTLDELKKSYLDNFRQQLSDSSKRSGVIGQVANDLAMQAIQASIKLSDDDLKQTGYQYSTKRIYINGDKHKDVDPHAKAVKILEDLKAKKLTFEQAMDQYTDDVPAQGKKPEENIFSVDGRTIRVSDDYKPILNLKPGELSDVLAVGPTGAAIYRLDHVQTTPPPDFDKNKAQIRSDYTTTMAAGELQKDLKALKDKGEIKWSSPGYQALYDWYQLDTGQDLAKKSPADQKKVWQDLMKRAEDAKKADQVGGDKAAVLAAYGAFDKIYSAASESEKAALSTQRITMLQDFLGAADSSAVRTDLLDEGLKKKDAGLVTDNLKQLAELNAGDLASTGQKRFGDLVAKLDQARGLKLLKPEDDKKIQDNLDRWKKDKLSYDAEMEKQRKEDEEQRKKSEAEAKKAAEEAKKKAATGPKTTVPGPVSAPPGPVKSPPMVHLTGGGAGTPAPAPAPPPPASGTTPPKTTGK